jgi:hypothetical protein
MTASSATVQSLPMTACASTCALAATRALAATTALMCTPGTADVGGCNDAAMRAYAR